MSASTISTSALPVASLGTPRIGPRRELKFALESFWSGATDESALIEAGAGLRAANWARQKKLGVTVIPSNDFSFYDQVLDTSVMVGAIPEIYRWDGGPVPLATYFAMARGAQGETHEADCGHAHHGNDAAHGVPAQEMTKWFDTNYHYMVPELTKDQKFVLASRKPIEEYEEALALGYQTRPVLVGPVTFLKLAKSKDAGFNPLSLLDRLLPVYIEVLRELVYRGAEWVQIDEPCLVLDLDIVAKQALHYAYAEIARAVPQLKIMLTSYFGGLGGNRDTALSLPVAGLHLDLVRAPDQLDHLDGLAKDRVLSLGVIDGRNIWRADLSGVLDRLEPVVAKLGKDRVQVAPSCSLLHVPIDLALETGLDSEIKSWLAFSVQKIEELTALATALAGGRRAAAGQSEGVGPGRRLPQGFAPGSRCEGRSPHRRHRRCDAPARQRIRGSRRRAARAFQPARLPDHDDRVVSANRRRPESARRTREGRADGRSLQIVPAGADGAARCAGRKTSASTCSCMASSNATTWCSISASSLPASPSPPTAGCNPTGRATYARRCCSATSRVRRPMTVEWWQYAQSLTKKPMKAMLTGPVTILNWSFVRDDIPRSEACRQIALAIRDEVADLEAAGAGMIQIDEAALREGLPLRKSEWKAYLDWAVEAFRLCSSGVRDETQIHTHMCYSEFNDIIDAIGAMDADVISIETSRSKMELLDAFRDYRYPERNRPRRLRHPFAAGARYRRDDQPARAGAKATYRHPDLDQSGLRPEDPQMGRGTAGACQHGRRRPRISGSA